MKKTALEIILSYIPQRLSCGFDKLPQDIKDRLSEVRVRSGRPLSVVLPGKVYYISDSGEAVTDGTAVYERIPSKDDMAEILRRLCRYSVHSFERELMQGFFTIEGGIRVGVSGVRNDASSPIKYAGGFNFRLSREIKGVSEDIYRSILADSMKSILICGAPDSGKTTVLRDLCRLCGNAQKVTVIDERNEISASVDGIPSFDIGIQTDILEGISRIEGIITAVRTLSPHIIVCDEISASEDVNAIMTGAGSGVRFIATVHAGSYDDLFRKKWLSPLLSDVFEYAVILRGESFPGKIAEIRRLK